jgi:hypothetical protein
MRPVHVFIGTVMLAAFVILSLWAIPAIGPSERFIIPDGYAGPVIAIYRQAGGQSPVMVGDTAVYTVPESGILRIAGAPPLPGSNVVFAFPDSPGALESIGPCSNHHLEPPPDDRTRACWHDFDVGGTNIPYHIVAVISDTRTIGVNYDRTMAVYDSVVFNRRGHATGTWKSIVDFETEKSARRKKR